jgi:hypothetical protein
MLPFVLYLYLVYRVTKQFEGQSMHDIMCRVFGKTVSKVVCVVLIFWLILLAALYLRYAGEQAVTSTYVGTDINLIIFVYVLFIGIILRWGVQMLNRMAFIIWWVGLLQFLIVLGFILTAGDLKNITPVSTLDIIPILKGIPFVFTVNSYIFIFFIFNDQVEYGKTKNFRKFVYTAVFILFAVTSIIIAVLSTFGYELSIDLNFPFLAAIDNITIMNSSVGLSALFYAAWVSYEMVSIAVFIYAALRLIRNVFNLNSQTPALTAVAGFCFFFAVYLCNDSFELESFSYNIITYGNITLFVFLPVLLFVVAKIRKLLPPPPKRQRKQRKQSAVQT